MQFILTLLTNLPFPAFPTLPGWAAWLALLALLIYLLYRWRAYHPKWKRPAWIWFALLLVLVPLTSLFIGARLSAPGALPMPGLPAEAPGSIMMFFSALPWTVGGAVLGPIPAAVLGALAGLLRGVWDTHNIFSILELAFMAALFSVSLRQRYRTPLFRFLRQPLAAALLLIPVHVLFLVLAALFTLSTSTAARLDFALSNMLVSNAAFAGEMLVAGLIGQLAGEFIPSLAGSKGNLLPSPAERSLETRFLIGSGAFVLLILVTLLVGIWLVAGRSARGMLQDRMSGVAGSAAQSVPFFMETGQNLIARIASEPSISTLGDPELSAILGREMQAVTYFDQLFLVDAASGSLLGGYPPEARSAFSLTQDEQAGLALASQGVLMQVYPIPPEESGQDSARISFLAAIQENGAVSRLLLGRSSLSTNPLTQPLLSSLESLDDLNGVGLLLDEQQRILYRTTRQEVMSVYEGAASQPGLTEDTAPDGTRQLVYTQPVPGRPWSVVLAVPARQAQQLAINLALPLSLMIFLLALVALLFLRLGLRVVTRSVRNLSYEANRIAGGQLDHPLSMDGVDEVGQLRRAFEQMRLSLQARMDELNHLLFVSQSVASSLEVEDAMKPVLEAMLSTGASCARVVLKPGVMIQDDREEAPEYFQAGPSARKYAHLDEQVMGQAQARDYIAIPGLALARDFPLNLSMPNPAALLAVPLRYENRYYGALWAAYEQTRSFSQADIRFAQTLAGQAALAISNTSLYQNVVSGRRQLEAILNSTPDPVLVTDHHNRLLLANQAANHALGLDGAGSAGQPTERVIQQRVLFDLLQASTQQQQSAEIVLKDKRTYLATASTVKVDGRPVGRVCILRDVTHFKELDTMKSQFVATVSHDLRSPLTLMRGYATMLPMVGEMNEQQQSYARKIISGVENMTRLVNNLLDLGRIEVGVGLELESVAVLDILERVTGSLQQQAAQKEIELSLQLPRDMPHAVEADAALLHQAIYNLVENALKYTPPGGRVILRTVSGPETITFEVSDTGIGIPAEDLPRLFEKFYRGSQREARAQHGSGLGLAIVHSIAGQHGGRVWVDSEPGKGSTFHLEIPLAQEKTGTDRAGFRL